jgi:hypothetical protein
MCVYLPERSGEGKRRILKQSYADAQEVSLKEKVSKWASMPAQT